jgi:hypothetical protein
MPTERKATQRRSFAMGFMPRLLSRDSNLPLGGVELGACYTRVKEGPSVERASSYSLPIM